MEDTLNKIAEQESPEAPLSPERPDSPPRPPGGESGVTRVDEQDVETAEHELLEGHRVVEVGRGKRARKVKVIRPRPSMDEQANIIRSRAIARYARDPDLMFEAEMLEVLEGRGIWTKKDDLEIEALDTEEYDAARDIEQLQRQIETADAHDKSGRKKQKSIEKFEKVRVEVNRKRSDLETRRQQYLSNTIEYLAGLQRRDYFFRQCVVDPETDKPLWSTDEEFDRAAEEDTEVFAEALVQVMAFWNGLPGSATKDSEAF